MIRTLVLVAALAGAPALAQQVEPVRFAPGASGAAIAGAVKGHGYVDHVLRAKAGQVMTVDIAATGGDGDGSVFYNILPAGKDFPALFVGQTAPDAKAEVTLPETGDWAIRTYLMGNDRDAGKTVTYRLDVAIR